MSAHRARWTRLWVAAAVLGIALALVATTGCGRNAKVPNVVGMPVDQAVKTLEDAGYKIGATRYGFTSNLAPETVARQTPAAGSTLERRGEVTLLVVRPLGSLQTPDLVGRTQEQAESALTTFSLTADVTHDYSSLVESGVVMMQAPAAGALIDPGDTVGFVVSKGPAPVTVKVPAINGKRQADAEAALRAVGLVPISHQAYSDNVAKGSVFGQNPVAGASMSPGSKVTFVVSMGKGATSLAVPNVVGKAQADAEAALRGAGLVPSVVLNINSSVPKGIVYGQNPTAGTKTTPGAVVGILVSLGPDTSAAVPNVVGKTSAEASAAIVAVGLVPHAAEQPDSTVPKGAVISQGPAAGTKAAVGSTVVYTVSSGAPEQP